MNAVENMCDYIKDLLLLQAKYKIKSECVMNSTWIYGLFKDKIKDLKVKAGIVSFYDGENMIITAHVWLEILDKIYEPSAEFLVYKDTYSHFKYWDNYKEYSDFLKKVNRKPDPEILTLILSLNKSINRCNKSLEKKKIEDRTLFDYLYNVLSDEEVKKILNE